MARTALAVWMSSALAGLATSAVAAESSDAVLARLDELEQEVAVLRRQLEVKSEADATRAKETPTSSFR